MKLNEENKSFFKEKGYIIVDNVFLEKDIKNFKSSLDYLVNEFLYKARAKTENLNKKSNGCFSDKIRKLIGINSLHISSIQRMISCTPEFINLISNENVNIMIKYLLDISALSPLYIAGDNIIFTNTKTVYETFSDFNKSNWYINTSYTVSESPFLQIWAPLYYDADEKINTLTICPNSNKIDSCMIKPIYNPDLPYDNQYYVSPKEISKYEQISISLKPGQLLIFAGKTLHCEAVNLSQYIGCTLVGLYHNTEVETFNPLPIYQI